MRTGVPTPPNVTAVLWIIIPSITAAAAGKPTATINGAAMDKIIRWRTSF